MDDKELARIKALLANMGIPLSDINTPEKVEMLQYLVKPKPEEKARGGKVRKKRMTHGGPVKKYATGGGVRKPKTYG
jgi:hypothetical protein